MTSILIGNPLHLDALMRRLTLAKHCNSCKNELGTWSLTSKSDLKRTNSSCIQISIGCCALDSLTLLDVQSLLVRPHYIVDDETGLAPCGICWAGYLRIAEPESSPTMENLTLRGSNILHPK